MKSIAERFQKMPLVRVAFFQALGLVFYCGLVGTVFWQGDRWFGRMDNFLGPVLMLVLLVVSVLVCALIGFGYPFLLFWEEKKPKAALRLVFYTARWLIVFVLLAMLSLLILK